MEGMKWAIPKPDIIVRDPRNKTILPTGGAYVMWTGPEGRYWRRRNNDGSISVSDNKPEEKIFTAVVTESRTTTAEILKKGIQQAIEGGSDDNI